jgi:hypothetical protein
MMYLDTPPRLIGTEVFSAMPDGFRRKGQRTDWADANRPGQPTDCFIEGPSLALRDGIDDRHDPGRRSGRVIITSVTGQDSNLGSKLT